LAEPVIFSYLDYRAFLQDWFDTKKRENPAYSYARFAKDGGCSRAALANVLSGDRTPRPSTLDAFAQAMELEGDQRNYLGLMVELASAPNVDARSVAMAKMLRIERYGKVLQSETESDDDIGRYLGNWWTMAIRELATLPGFRADPRWLAQTLHPPITEEQASKALNTLFDLEFIASGDDGAILVNEIRFRTEPEAFQQAVTRFHQDVVPDRIGQVDLNDVEIQQLMGATLIMPMGLVAEAKVRVANFVDQMANLTDSSPPGDAPRAYQLYVHLFPVSQAVKPPPV
jgi:uncharacterized protein (TIGR02147 family)